MGKGRVSCLGADTDRMVTTWPGARGVSNWEVGLPSTVTSLRESRDLTLLRLFPLRVASRKGRSVVGSATV